MFACYIVYNSAHLLEESLLSVVDHVEKVIMIDGTFQDYLHKMPYSTDGTYELAKKICGDKLQWIHTKKIWTHPITGEIPKRNQYLKYIPNGKCFIVVDYDEVLTGPVKEEFQRFENSNSPYGLIPFTNYMFIWDNKTKGSPSRLSPEEYSELEWYCAESSNLRVFRKTPELHYEQHHSVLYDGSNKLFRRDHRMCFNCLTRLRLTNQVHLKTWREFMLQLYYKCKKSEHRISPMTTEEMISLKERLGF